RRQTSPCHRPRLPHRPPNRRQTSPCHRRRLPHPHRPPNRRPRHHPKLSIGNHSSSSWPPCHQQTCRPFLDSHPPRLQSPCNQLGRLRGGVCRPRHANGAKCHLY